MIHRLHAHRFLPVIVLALGAFQLQAKPVLDASFGTNGTSFVQGIRQTNDQVIGSLVQRDGKMLVSLSSFGRATTYSMLRFTTGGVLDATFGQGGVAAVPLATDEIRQTADGTIWTAGLRLSPAGVVQSTYPVPSQAYAHHIVPQPDGGVTIVSDAGTNSQLALRLIRLDPSGNRDTRFAPNGEKVLDNLGVGSMTTGVGAIVVETDGSFAVLAESITGTFQLVRVTPEGNRDPAFGRNGVISTLDAGSLSPQDRPTQIARALDGKILIVGFFSGATSTRDLSITRITRTGTLDASFGAGGRLVPGASAFFDAYLATVLDDGRIALLQTSFGGPGVANPPDRTRIRMLDDRGQPDPGFGTAGIASISIAGYDGQFAGRALWPGGSGGFLIPGLASTVIGCNSNNDCFRNGIDVAVADVDSRGQLVPGYGRGDGFAIWKNFESSLDEIDTILVEPSGRIVLAGDTTETLAEGFLVERLTSNGAPDPSFGTNGRALRPISNFHSPVNAVVQGNGAVTVVAAGDRFTPPRAFRVDGNGVLDPAFVNTLDGPSVQGAPVGFAARPDGRLLYGTVVYLNTNSRQNAVIQQRLPDGSRDTGFGTNGDVFVPLDPNESASQSELHVLGDGSILFASLIGYVTIPNRSVRVWKLDPLGQRVRSFGTDGELRLPGAALLHPQGIVPLPDGGFVAVLDGVAGEAPGTTALRVQRFDSNGVLRSDRLVLSSTETFPFRNSRLLALPDTSIVISRSAGVTGPTRLYRLLPDDTLDPGFGDGVAFVLPGVNVTAMGLDEQSRMLVAGQNAATAFVARYDLDGSISSADAVEYYNTVLGHYFVTLGPGEIASIDAGGAGPGWQRTGQRFKAYLPESGIPIGAVPVCRFYGTPGRGPNSHFYTASAAECAAVKLDAGWMYEGIAFHVIPPQNDRCPGSTAVYRAYNNGFARNDSNHRYSTQLPVLQAMTAQGWSVEGVAFCGAAD